MNIFALDNCPVKAAKAHFDGHVNKMILESAQMLCTALHFFPSKEKDPGSYTLYKKTHVNHPCSIWVRESLDNWEWLVCLAFCLNEEAKERYGHIKNHKSFDVIHNLPKPNIPSLGRTPFALAMSDIYKISKDPVECYRTYYLFDKANNDKIKHYNRVEPPEWISETLTKYRSTHPTLE